MASIKDVERVKQTAEGSEMARLRRDLAEARTRLDEETAYFRAELEASRQRVEKQHVREHADEVVKRRRAEAQNLTLKEELRQARLEAETIGERCEELARQLTQFEEAGRRHTQREVEKVRATAAVAWQSAEEELARAEQEHAADKRLLAEEQARRSELEATVAALRQRAEGPDPDSQRLIGSLKKALWATGQARRRAEIELAALRGETGERDGQAAAPSASPSSGPGLYNELNPDDLKALSLGDINDLSDDFRLVMGDDSLELDPEPTPAPPAIVNPIVAIQAPQPALPKAPPPPRVEILPAYETEPRPGWVDRSRQSIGRVLRDLLIGVGLTAAGYWLLRSGLLAQLLG